MTGTLLGCSVEAVLNALSIINRPDSSLLFAALFASVLTGVSRSAQELGPKEIIQRSAEVNRRDWDAAPGYDYFQRERNDEKINKV